MRIGIITVSVAGRRVANRCATDSLVAQLRPQSKVTICFRKMPNWVQSGSFRPSCWRTASTWAALAFWPARISAGSPPKPLKSRKTSRTTPNIVGTICQMRRIRYAVMRRSSPEESPTRRQVASLRCRERLPAMARPLAATVVAVTASLALGASSAPPTAAPAATTKVLRYALRVAETGFDPAQISDLYSSTLAANIFDALYEYEFLARPVRLRPNTATALPEASADFKTFTIRVRPGIYFSDDPAFKGVRRELTAADYVYSIKRHFDPRWKSPTYTTLNNNRIVGLDEVRQAALRDKKPFDYDTPGRGPARARPLHDPVQARRAQSALHRSAARSGAHRRGRARGGRVLRRQDHGAPGRHRAVPAGAVAAQLADRVREEPRLPRRLLSRRKRRRDDPLAQAAVSAARRPQAADDRPRRDQHHRGAAAALARVRSTARWTSSSRCRRTSPTSRSPTTRSRRTWPSRASTKCAIRATTRACRTSRWRTRSSAATRRRRSRCAGRSRWRSTSTRRSAWSGAARRSRRSRPMAPGLWGYDPAFRSEMSVFDRAKAKALLDLLRLRRPRRRRLARPARRPAARPRVRDRARRPQPPAHRRSGRRTWTRSASASSSGTRKWPENLKASRAGKLMMWGVAWSGGPGRRGRSSSSATAPRRGRPTTPRFELAEYNRLFQIAAAPARWPRADARS